MSADAPKNQSDQPSPASHEGRTGPLIIHYHRDFDGMVSAAVLASILRDCFSEKVEWHSVNYDQRKNWAEFGKGTRFAIVDFHFHPDAQYWFDHHPTTFLSDELRAQYKASDRWLWDEKSPSCPPMVLDHAVRHWKYRVPERFKDMAHWSNIIDAARFESVDQAVFGDEPALRISRALTVSPNDEWLNQLVGAMTKDTLEEVANRPDLNRAFDRASRNRDKALEQFPPCILSNQDGVLFYDASSNRIRRERFAPFYHHPEIHYAVGVIPTRAGYHISAGENPWNSSPADTHIGQMMERFGGGGHKAVGGANPPSREAALELAKEMAVELRTALTAL